MKILANQNEHAANTAERLESYARRIAAMEAELATERARLDYLISRCIWTEQQKGRGIRQVIDDAVMEEAQ